MRQGRFVTAECHVWIPQGPGRAAREAIVPFADCEIAERLENAADDGSLVSWDFVAAYDIACHMVDVMDKA